MASIIFARHGETDNNRRKIFQGILDSDLNSTGFFQARTLAKFCENLPLAKVVTSPLKRAFETANAVISIKNIPLIVLEDIREICYGSWEGKSREEVSKLSDWKKREKNFYSFVHPGDFRGQKGESYRTHYQKLKPFFTNLEKEKGTVLIVSHQGTIRGARKYFEKKEDKDFEKLTLDNNEVFLVEKSPTKIKTRIIRLNQ
jgi:broad specificity phosphatase PhoE